MAFNVNKFNNTELQQRTAVVSVPELKDWFDADETPEWTVRQLSHSEIARAEEMVNSTDQIVAIAQALASSKSNEKADAVKEILGVGENTPAETSKRCSYLTFGSVKPEIDRSAAVKIFHFFPIVGAKLSNKILELSGLGAEVGKPKRSTEAKK